MIEIPVDGVDAVRFEKCIAFGEVLAAEKAIVRRQRRGMHAFEHKVLRCSDEFLFAAGIAAPEQKDDRLLMLVQLFDYMVGEGRPAEVFMAVRLPTAYGQSRVQHEHTALRPLGERAVLGRYNAEITLQLLEDVLQARRRLNTRLNREAKSVRLAGTVIRVLSENDGLDLGIRRVPQSVKDVLCRRIDGLLGVFLFQPVAIA